MNEFFDPLYTRGQKCEYQIRPDVWISCEIVTVPFLSRTRYLARYVGHAGKVKTGAVDVCNLRLPANQP